MKQRNYRFIGIIACFLMVFSACEKVLEIDIPFKKRKIVVNCLINPDSSVQAHISKSLHILDKNNMAVIENADVNFYENGTLIDTMDHNGNGYYHLPEFKPEKGNAYKIKVSAKDHNAVVAEEVIPMPVSIISIDTSRTTNEYDEKLMKCHVKFKDPLADSNYYMVKAFVYMQFSEWDPQNDSTTYHYDYDDMWIQSDDPVVEESGWENPGLLFSDDYFKGKQYNLSFTFPTYHFNYHGEDEQKKDDYVVYIYLYSLSSSYYQYLRSYELQTYASEDPFAEKVTVYDNIKNGYGIFGGYSVDQDSIIIPAKSFQQSWNTWK